ncbi:hypothetical protein [Bacterioplanoides sp.]
MQLSSFQHGEYKISVSGRILVATVGGSWNEETALAYSEDLRSAAQPLITGDWGHIVFLEEWNLGVLEIVPVIEELVTWCLANGMKRSALVYPPSVLKRLQLHGMITEQGDFRRQSFATEQEAMEWLNAAGYFL